jgi:hypothetical protein
MGTARGVGLLTAPLTLVRAPIRVTLRAWGYGLSTAAEGARIGAELLEPGRGAPLEQRDNGAAPEVMPAEPEVTPVEPEMTPVEPVAVPDELVPDHVDEEPVLVAEVAEEGAQHGAGAELHVDAPWDGYDRMTAADIRDRLALATPAEAAAVELYESTRRARRSVLDAAERALRD